MFSCEKLEQRGKPLKASQKLLMNKYCFTFEVIGVDLISSKPLIKFVWEK
jgi:hypothetical protein